MNSIKLSNVLKFAIAGAIVAFVLISILVFSVDTPNPAWGKNWFVRPLIVTPLVTSFGGVFLYLINLKKTDSKILNLLLFFFSVLVFIFFLWIGTVLGLDGTLWD